MQINGKEIKSHRSEKKVMLFSKHRRILPKKMDNKRLQKIPAYERETAVSHFSGKNKLRKVLEKRERRIREQQGALAMA